MNTFTLVHVVISLIGIVSGIVVLLGFLSAKRLDGWNAIFLITTVLTSVTGFLFPFHKLLPSHILGVMSLVVLAFALFARYVRRMAGPWRRTYAITSSIALYFNVFVLIAQMFQKIPALKSLAPTQSEPPFLVVQLVCLVLFTVLTILAAIKFRPETVVAAA
jgi:hypothetical protein